MRLRPTVLLVLLACPPALAAQDAGELRRRVDALQKAVEQQAREIEELRRPLGHATGGGKRVPRSFPIPNGDAALKIGGLVRVNWVSTSDALLVDDRFQTSAIPVADTVDAGWGSRVAVIATPSRFNFDLRTPRGVGHMRALIEADFAGSGNTLRLRHAYGQWKRAIFGQTWSTFSDLVSEFLWGLRVNLDGARERATQTQIGATSGSER
jgi:hypothetical protein